MRAFSHFACASLLCAKFQKDRRRRVLPLQEFEAENVFQRVDSVLSMRVEGVDLFLTSLRRNRRTSTCNVSF